VLGDSRVGIVLGVEENINIRGVLVVTVLYVDLSGRVEVWVVVENVHLLVIWVVVVGSGQRRTY
jgi:hypothetical protein